MKYVFSYKIRKMLISLDENKCMYINDFELHLTLSYSSHLTTKYPSSSTSTECGVRFTGLTCPSSSIVLEF